MAIEKIPARLMCISCSRTSPIKDFYLNYNEIHEKYNYGRMYHCKSCCKEISQTIMNNYWNQTRNRDDKLSFSLGVRAVCSFFHMPYLNEAMVKLMESLTTKSKERDINYVYQYMAVLEELEIPNKYWNDLSGNSFLPLDLLNNVALTANGDRELFVSLETNWGKQDTLEDYLFLEKKFKDYTDGESLNATMTNMIRYLCEAELDVNKLKDSKANIGDISKAEKRVTDYYSKLKLDDFKFNKQKTLIEKSMEEWAYKFEQTEPLDWVDEHMDDICHFREDNDEIARSIANKVIGNKDYPKLTLEDVKKSKKKK